MSAFEALMALPEAEKAERGVEYTPGEIAQQPSTWAKAVEVLRGRREEIAGFMEDAGLRGAGDATLLLTGAGTSEFVGNSIVNVLRRRLGREAVFALASVEAEWLAGRRGIRLSRVREALEEAMAAHPAHWQRYYHGEEADLRVARKYSYSDRSRYYWPRPEVQRELDRLLANLSARPAPMPLLSQYLPVQYAAVREGRLSPRPVDLIHDKVMEVTACYAYACGVHSK